jgi:hypothetical protein
MSGKPKSEAKDTSCVIYTVALFLINYHQTYATDALIKKLIDKILFTDIQLHRFYM